MTARGPAWEGDPAAARLGYDPQTAPLPYGVTSGDPYRETAPYLDQDPDGYGPAGYGRPATGRAETAGASRAAAAAAACCAGWWPCWPAWSCWPSPRSACST